MTRASDTAKLLGAGATILDGTTISTADNTDQLILKSTDADANVGPVLRLNRDSGSPADNDLIGSIIFQADDDGGNTTNLVEFITQIEDASNGSESADLHIKTRRLGSLVSRIGMYNSTTVINEDSADIDFRVEGNGNANVLFVEGETDRVAIGHNDPSQLLDVRGSGAVGIGVGSTDAGGVSLILDGDSNGDAQGSDYCVIQHDTSGRLNIIQDSPSGTNELRLFTNAAERMRIDATGNITMGGGGTSITAPNPGIIANNAGKLLLGKNNSTDDSSFLDFRRNGTVIGRVLQNGTTGVTYETSSDYRLKENVVTSWDATIRLKQLKPSRFNFISEADRTVDGFLAHEVQEIVPEAISGTKDGTEDVTNVVLNADGTVLAQGISETDWEEGKLSTTDKDGNTVDPIYASDTTWVASKTVPDYQGIDQSKLVPLLVKTIQELEARITALES